MWGEMKPGLKNNTTRRKANSEILSDALDTQREHSSYFKSESFVKTGSWFISVACAIRITARIEDMRNSKEIHFDTLVGWHISSIPTANLMAHATDLSYLSSRFSVYCGIQVLDYSCYCSRCVNRFSGSPKGKKKPWIKGQYYTKEYQVWDI